MSRLASGIRHNLIACIALFVALGGSAYAAIRIPADSVGTRQIKTAAVTGAKLRRSAVTSSKVKDGSLLAKDFKQAPTGPAGLQGAPGSPAASAFTSHFGVGVNTTNYGPVSGIGPYDNSDDGAVMQPSPAVPIVARDLYAASVSELPGTTGVRRFTLLVNGNSTALTCTATRPATTSCTDTAHAVQIPPGSLMSILYERDGNTSSGFAAVSFRATTP